MEFNTISKMYFSAMCFLFISKTTESQILINRLKNITKSTINKNADNSSDERVHVYIPETNQIRGNNNLGFIITKSSRLIADGYNTLTHKAETSTTRQPSYFYCANGAIEPFSYRCDGDNDCRDNSDEIGCGGLCKAHICNSGLCISNSRVCDGIRDCSDISDEMFCPYTFYPPDTHRPSTIAPNSTTKRQPSHFYCANGIIEPFSYRCDGDNDCGDNSDEIGCGGLCKAYICNSGLCISNNRVCDRIHDCSDDSDEKFCHYTLSPPITNRPNTDRPITIAPIYYSYYSYVPGSSLKIGLGVSAGVLGVIGMLSAWVGSNRRRNRSTTTATRPTTTATRPGTTGTEPNPTVAAVRTMNDLPPSYHTLFGLDQGSPTSTANPV